MKIQFATDLHLEFPENRAFLKDNPIIPVGDILVLAGDIVPFAQMNRHAVFFKFCSDNFSSTYWLPGNHEYYNSDLNGRTGQFIENIESNVHLVNNYWVQKENVRLIFSTLWTRISSSKAWQIQNSLSDYHVIKDKGKGLTTSRTNELFEENFSYLQEAVANNSREKCIVFTHHVPTFQEYPAEYKGSDINEGFAVDLDHFITSSHIDYWIYGHHHRNVNDFRIGTTQLMTNQLGYVEYSENKGFNPFKTIEV